MEYNTFSNNAKYYDYFTYPEVLGDSDLYLKYCIPGLSVLELGCGTGRIGIEIAKKGYFIDEVDISRSMLYIYKKKLVGLDKNIRNHINLINTDMRSFQLNKKYGLIIVPFNTITYLNDEDLNKTLKLVKQHLAKQGSVMIHVSRLDWDSNIPLALEKLWGVSTCGSKTFQYIHWIESKNEAEKSIIYCFRHDIFENDKLIIRTKKDSLKIWCRKYGDYLALFAENGFVVTNFWNSFTNNEIIDIDKIDEQYIFRLKSNG